MYCLIHIMLIQIYNQINTKNIEIQKTLRNQEFKKIFSISLYYPKPISNLCELFNKTQIFV